MNNSMHPIDKGWSWIILIGCTINTTLVVGSTRAFGIYFVEFISTFGTDVSVTSLITGLLQIIYSLVSLPVMTFGLRYMTVRQSIFAGGIIISVAYMIGSFAPSVGFLLFSNGILFGIGFGLINGPATYLTSLYFNKRRNLANSILLSGGGMGGLILPPIYRLLLDSYELRGSLLITAGILLHSVAASLLLRPISFYESKYKGDEENNDRANSKDKFTIKSKPILRRSRSLPLEETDCLKIQISKLKRSKSAIFNSKRNAPTTSKYRYTISDDTNGVISDADKAIQLMKRNTFTTLPSTTERVNSVTADDIKISVADDKISQPGDTTSPSKPEHDINISVVDRTLKSGDRRSSITGNYSSASKPEHNTNKSVKDNISQSRDHKLSTMNISSSQLKSEHDRKRSIADKLSQVGDRKSSIMSTSLRSKTSRKSVSMDSKTDKERTISPRLLCNPLMIIFVLALSFGSLGGAYGGLYITHFAEDNGIDDTTISLIISTINGCDVVGRIFFGMLSDRNVAKNHVLVATSLAACSLNMFFSFLYKEMWSIFLFSVIHGLISGSMVALSPALIIDFLGLDNYRTAMGVALLSQGFAMCAVLPIIGALRDLTGTYMTSFQFLGGCYLLSSSLLYFEPCLRKYRISNHNLTIEIIEERQEQTNHDKFNLEN